MSDADRHAREAALRASEAAGQLRSTPAGFEAAGTMREPCPSLRPGERGSTAAALDRMTRHDRVKTLWAAMRPADRERAWARLNVDQRVDALVILFDAAEQASSPPATTTFSGAIDAWQRRNDR